MATDTENRSRQTRDRVVAAAVILAAVTLAATGVPRLIADGDASYRLPDDHPLHRLNERFVEATGGDDVMGVLLSSEEGLITPEGAVAVSTVHRRLAETGTLTDLRDFTKLSLVTVRDGAVTGDSPLDPRPDAADASAWEAARARLQADPFARGLVAEDGTAALVVGWVRRAEAESLFVDQVDLHLKDEEFRGGPEGKPLRTLIDGVRLAVMMGEREGPPDVAVAKALTEAAAGDGPEASYLRRVGEAVRRQAEAPETAAREAVLEAITAAPDGVELLPVGSTFVRSAMLVGYPEHVHLGFIGLFAALSVLVGRRRESLFAALTAVAAGSVALGGAVGVLGWFGLPLHPISAQFLLGLALLAALGLLGAGTPRQPRLELLLLVLLPWCSRDLHGVSGLALSGALATAWAVVWVWGREATRLDQASARPRLDPDLLGLTRRPSSRATAAASLLVAGGLVAALSQPLGIRPVHWLPDDDPVGAALRLMDQKLGGGTPVYLVSPTAAGGMADPLRLTELHAAGAALEADPAVESVVGWTDFLATVHSAVSGAQAGSLPDRADLVQQYLLMFDRPSETKPLVAVDRSLGVGFVRMEPGRDGDIARLAGSFPAGRGGPALAGEAVALAVGGRLATRSLGLLLGLGLLVGFGALVWVPAPGSTRPATFEDRLASALRAVHAAVPAGCVAVGVAAMVAGALGAEALLAGAAVAGTSLAVARCDERDRLQAFVLIGVGLGALILGPIAPLRGLGLGAFVGSVTALGLGRTAG